MPYISKEMKDRTCHRLIPGTFETKVDAVIELIWEFNLDDREGPCNYAITRIVAESLKPQHGWRFKHLNRAYGVFMSAAAEFYRRVAAPHEDQSLAKNGDIYD